MALPHIAEEDGLEMWWIRGLLVRNVPCVRGLRDRIRAPNLTIKKATISKILLHLRNAFRLEIHTKSQSQPEEEIAGCKCHENIHMDSNDAVACVKGFSCFRIRSKCWHLSAWLHYRQQSSNCLIRRKEHRLS
jgi:hypothetical protein